MKLATADEVLARANVSNTMVANHTAAVESALEAASVLVASILQTPLEEMQRIDWFSYQPSKFQRAFEPLVLKLHQRFLNDQAVTVYYSEDGAPAQTEVAFEMVDTGYAVNRERGTVHLYVEPVRGYKTIAVKYSAGFSTGSVAIPTWMKESAISAALHVHHAHAISHNKDDQPDMSKVMAGILYTQLNEYITVDYEAEPSIDSVVQ